MKAVLAGMIAVAFAAAGAQGSGVGVFGSYLDAGDLGDGYGGGVKLKMDLGTHISAQASVAYLPSFDASGDGGLLDGDIILVPVEGALLANLPLGEKVTAYAGGGIGYYVLPEYEVKSPLTGVPGSREPDVDLDDTVGWFGEAGLEFKLAEQVVLFVAAKYQVAEVDGASIDDSDVDLDDEVDLSGFGISLGLMAVW